LPLRSWWSVVISSTSKYPSTTQYWKANKGKCKGC